MTVGELKTALEGYEDHVEVYCSVPYGLLHARFYDGAYSPSEVEEGSMFDKPAVFLDSHNFQIEESFTMTNRECNQETDCPDCPCCGGEGYCLTCNGCGYLEDSKAETL